MLRLDLVPSRETDMRLAAVLYLAAGIVLAAPGRGVPAEPAAVLVLTVDEALRAKDVALAEDGKLTVVDAAASTPSREIFVEKLILLRFPAPRADRPPAAWLCLRDGRRLRGAAIRIARDAVTLMSSSGQEIASASSKEISALHFRSPDPSRISPPPAGVRLLSVDGEPLDAPAVTLGEGSVTVEMDPSLDPVRFPLERLSGLVWAEEVEGSGEPRAGSARGRDQAIGKVIDPVMDQVIVELRSGERRKGTLVSLGKESLVLREGGAVRALPRREIDQIWFGSHRGTPVDARAPQPPAGPERPLWRVGKDALGGPLRIGARTCETGIGLRAPARVEIPVPRNAAWLLALAGASADAAPGARVTVEILVGGKPAARIADKQPGSPAEEIAVPVRGASSITVRASAAGADATGCLGGLGDALFVE
jgi:hypothetical protein